MTMQEAVAAQKHVDPEAELHKIQQALTNDPILRVSQATLFISQRLSVLASMVMKDRLQKAGVALPTLAIRGMLRDQELVDGTIGPFTAERLETEIDKVLPHYISTLHAAGVTLADLEKTNDDGKPTPGASPSS
jgi:hypothetical protein